MMVLQNIMRCQVITSFLQKIHFTTKELKISFATDVTKGIVQIDAIQLRGRAIQNGTIIIRVVLLCIFFLYNERKIQLLT